MKAEKRDMYPSEVKKALVAAYLDSDKTLWEMETDGVVVCGERFRVSRYYLNQWLIDPRYNLRGRTRASQGGRHVDEDVVDILVKFVNGSVTPEYIRNHFGYGNSFRHFWGKPVKREAAKRLGMTPEQFEKAYMSVSPRKVRKNK